MNDQQLVAALRGLDRPVTPEPEPDFADALFDQLRRQAFPVDRRPMQRNVLLVAALLAGAALGLALAVGSRLFDQQLLVQSSPAPVGTTAPAATPAYAVEVPEGIVPASPPEAVASVVQAVGVGRFGLTGPIEDVILLRWQPPNTEVATPDGGAMSSAVAFWAVTVTTADGDMVFLVSDGALDIVGTDGPHGEPTPAPTLTVLPTRDPAVPLRLVGPAGLAIDPMLIPIPGAEERPQVGPLVVAGDLLWALWTPISTDGPMRLLRVDASTSEVSSIALPDDLRFGSLVGGAERLWLSTGSELIALDATRGSILERFPVEGSVTGETSEGVWLRTVTPTEPAIGGAVLVDPSTGREIRRLTSPEGPGQAYVGMWQPPAFGSLWDVDRSTGLLHRLDPATGASTATIDLGAGLAASCGADFGPVGNVPGFGDVVGGACSTGLVLVDPASDAIVGTVAAGGVSIGAAWWSLRTPEPVEPGWDTPGALVRSTSTGAELALPLSLDRYGGRALAVAGGALWLLVAERAEPNQDYEHNAALLRIPIEDLPT